MNANNLYSTLLKAHGVRPQRWPGAGGAYFYWVDKSGACVTARDVESVYVTRLDQLSIAQWTALAADVAALIKAEEDEKPKAEPVEPLPPAPEGQQWRWTLSHVDRDGFRVFTLDNRAASHKAWEALAEKSLAAMFKNNTVRGLREVYGPNVVETLRVDPVLCWMNGDRAPGINPRMNEYHPDLDTSASDKEARDRIATAFAGGGGRVVRKMPVRLSFGRVIRTNRTNM